MLPMPELTGPSTKASSLCAYPLGSPALCLPLLLLAFCFLETMKIKYNSPTVLTFVPLGLLVLLLSQTLFGSLTQQWFLVPGKGGFSASSLRSWVTLFTHVLGHAHWPHLVSNFSFILLIGPMLEEVYGSFSLLVMLCITAFITGVLNVLFFSSGLLGASGIVFMFILLASFSNFKKGEIPLTFLLVLVLYLGKELYQFFAGDTRNVSVFAHMVGGLIGSLFGFLRIPRNTAHSQL